MARIRTIKPEFWTSAQVMDCSPMARLLFIGMWNFADDAGRMAYSPKTLKAQIYPSDDITSADVARLVVELSSNGLVLIYSADGKEFISIPGWHHQKIDKPKPSKLPDPFGEQSTTDSRKVAPDPILSYPILSEEVADAADARAKPNPGKAGQQAHDLAEQLLEIAGHSRHAWPPGWCGAPLRVRSWFEQGWEPEIILSAVRACMARRNGSPVSSVQFFEKAIAEEHARQAAPVPKVEIRQAETITVTSHVKPRSGIIQAADNLVERIASFDGPSRGTRELRGSSGTPAPRLLPNG